MDLVNADVFVRRMGTRRIARPHFQRGKSHQRLIAQRGRTIRSLTQSHSTAHQRMSWVYPRGVEPERTGIHLAFHVMTDFIVQLLVTVALITTYVNRKTTLGRHHIMLGTGIDNRYRHFHRSQPIRNPFKPMRPKPDNIVHCLVYGINAFITGSVAGTSVRRYVEDHQPLFGNRRLHPRGFPHYGHTDWRKQRQDGLNPALPGYFLFARSQIHQIIGLLTTRQYPKDLQQRHKPSSAIIATQSV